MAIRKFIKLLKTKKTSLNLKHLLFYKALKRKTINFFIIFIPSLQKGEESSFYSMTEWEKKVVEESILDYEKGDIIKNEDIFNKNEE